MKKILLSSAAVFAFAGAAAAGEPEVNWSGDAELGYNEQIEGGIYYNVGLFVNLEKELDNGWTAAGSLDIDFDEMFTFSGIGIDASDWQISISSDMGGLYFGDTALAADKYWSGVTNLNDDGFAENGDGTEDAVLRAEVMVGGVEAAISYMVEDQDSYGLTFGATAAFGNVSLYAAYQDSDVVGGEIFGLSAGAALFGADLMLSYADSALGNTSIGVSAAYPIGPVTVGAFYVVEDVEDDNYGVSADYADGPIELSAWYHGGSDEDWGIDASYDVGNGIMLYAGHSEDDGSYVAGTYDLGGGAEFLASYGKDAGNDEIGPEEFLDGVNVVLSLAF